RGAADQRGATAEVEIGIAHVQAPGRLLCSRQLITQCTGIAMTGLSNSAPRRVLVTGAGSGLGRALALRYARAGDRVACVDLDVPRAEATRALLTGSGHLALAADVGDDDAMETLHAAIQREWGGLDVLVNNAGI